MKRLLFLLLSVSFLTAIQAQTTWHVAPSDGQTGDGSPTNPWDLQTALNSAEVGAGDIILLGGGRYDGRYISTIQGTADNPIIVKSAPNQWAVINGNVPLGHPNDYNQNAALLFPDGFAGSSYVHFMNFEITATEDLRPLQRDSDASDYIPITGINHLTGENCKFINMVVHNMPGQGVGSWKWTAGTEFYGCIVYNNGIIDFNGTRRYEHGFYIQNITDQERLFRNNMVFNNFGRGLLFWSASQCTALDGSCDFLKNARFDNNVSFNNGNVKNDPEVNLEVATNDLNGTKIPKNITVQNNVLYHDVDFAVSNSGGGTSLSLGKYGANRVENSEITDNIIIGRNYAVDFVSIGNGLKFQNNTVFTRYTLSNNINITDNTGWDLDNNSYYTSFIAGFKINPPNTNYNIGDWRNISDGEENSQRYHISGFDDNPDNNTIKVTQNEYDPKKFTVVIVNPNITDLVNVDFSAFLSGDNPINPNSTYKIIDVENYHTIAQTGNLDSSSSIDFPMNLTEFEAPLKPSNQAGTLPDLTNKSANNFGVFIIEFSDACAEQTTWDGSTWSDGEPSADDLAIIDGIYDTAIEGGFEACSLEVTENGELTIAENTFIKILNNVTNNNTADKFVVKDSGSLVMVEDDGVVTGDIDVEIKWGEHLFDPNESAGTNSDKFSIWSTPMVEANSRINNTFSNNAITYYWDTSLDPDQFVQYGGNDNLIPGKGFYLRQNDGAAFDLNIPLLFEGEVNNGVVEDDLFFTPSPNPDLIYENFHFFGNPYPSGLAWSSFKEDNADLVEGAAYFWYQLSPTTVGEQMPQWYVLNEMGSVPDQVLNDTIPSGLGFSMKVKQAGQVVFNNSQRVPENNGGFFPTNSTQSDTDKIWLSLSNSEISAQTLIGFLGNCSESYNADCDADFIDDGAGIEFYSLVGDEKLSIQGKQPYYPGGSSTQIGFKATTTGTYIFDIVREHISDAYSVMLEDIATRTFTNLRETPYTFDLTETVEDNRRFVLHVMFVKPDIDASFTYEKPCDSYGLELDFTYTGDTDDASFSWDFGSSATPSSSTSMNPSGIVFTEGMHEVSLTVTKNGFSATETLIVDANEDAIINTRNGIYIVMCYRGRSVKVPKKYVSKYLRKGACIGSCEARKNGGETDTKSGLVITEVKLSPNPNNGVFTVQFDKAKTGSMEIVDSFGNVLLQQDVKAENEVFINLGRQPSGVYYIRLATVTGELLTEAFVLR